MEESIKDFIKNKIVRNFLNLDKTFKFGEYKQIFPDKNVIYFELNDSKYVLFFTDYIGNDIGYVSDELREIGLTVKEYIPLKKNSDIYIFNPSRKKLPFVYESVFDDSYVCGRI